MQSIDEIRDDFSILRQTAYGYPLVYLDNAATTQKPQIVLDRVVQFYQTMNSNVHRGEHYLAQQAEEAYEQAREKVRDFLQASAVEEIIFTRGTTEAINLVAHSFGQLAIRPDDEVIVTPMEHHSNLVPWQVMCEQRGAHLKILPMQENGQLAVEQLPMLISERTKIIAVTAISNVLGIINPIKAIIEIAHAAQVPVLVDAAQAAAHQPIDVQALDCDFLAFSGHKMYSLAGVGALYGKQKWLDRMPPYQTGGGMIENVSLSHSSYAPLPFKFEAGTGNAAAAVSLAAAIDYIQSLGWDQIVKHEQALLHYAREQLGQLEQVDWYGHYPQQAGVLSFNLRDSHPYDVAMLLDKQGIMVRSGHHCAQPLMEQLGLSGTVRLSLAVYNQQADIDRLTAGVTRSGDLLMAGRSGG